jgi:hypothetical protein
MGNTKIALPTDTAPDTPRMTDKPDRIPVAKTQQESRSVLVRETVTGRSPGSLTVLPAYGKSNVNRTIGKTSNLVASKRSLGLSWADVASGRKTSVRENSLFLRNLI